MLVTAQNCYMINTILHRILHWGVIFIIIIKYIQQLLLYNNNCDSILIFTSWNIKRTHMHDASAKNTRSKLKCLCTFCGKIHNKQLKRTINRIVIDNTKHSASPLLLASVVPLCNQLPPAVLNLANCNPSVFQNIYPVYFQCAQVYLI